MHVNSSRRSYENTVRASTRIEVAEATSTLIAPTQIVSGRHRPWQHKLGFILVIVVIIAGSVATFWYLKRPSGVAAPVAIHNLATGSTKIFYPKPLPPDIAFVSAEPISSGGVVTYTLSYQKQRIVVSAQPKPKDVIFKDFYDRVLQHKADVYNRNGTAVIGNAGGKTLGSLVTDDTWILINTSEDMDSTILTNLVSHLQQVK